MTVKRNIPKMETKKELMAYLRRNRKTELPFDNDVWNLALEKTAGKTQKMKAVEVVEPNGDVKIVKVPDGNADPVGMYFQLMGLPQYRKKYEELEKQNKDTIVDKKETEEVSIEDILDDNNEEKNSFISGLVNIYFSKVSDEDLKFVISRLSEYYTNYEFNEGSDKFLVTSVVSDELTLRTLYEKRLKGQDDEKRIKDIQDGYLKKLDGLKALKKSGGSIDEGQNKFTIFVDELEKAGELKYETPKVDNDVIGGLVKAINNSVIRAFSDG